MECGFENVENIVRKEENTGIAVFSPISSSVFKNHPYMVIYLFTKQLISRLVQTTLADNKINVTEKMKFLFIRWKTF